MTIAITHPGAGLKTQNSLRTASSLGLDTDLPARVVHADAVVKIPRPPEDVVVLLLEEVAAARAAATSSSSSTTTSSGGRGILTTASAWTTRAGRSVSSPSEEAVLRLFCVLRPAPGWVIAIVNSRRGRLGNPPRTMCNVRPFHHLVPRLPAGGLGPRRRVRHRTLQHNNVGLSES